MKKISSVFVAMFLLAMTSYAQQSVAYFDSKAPVTRVQKNVTFQVTLDNINDAGEKDSFSQKFKTSKVASSVTASEIAANKVTYDVTTVEDNFFKSIQDMIIFAGITNVVIDGKPMSAKLFYGYCKAEYDKTKPGAARPTNNK